MRRFGLQWAVGFAIAALASGSGFAGEIVVGESAPFSGSLGPVGQDIHNGVELYFEEVNSRGGVNGSTLRLVALDDGYVSERTVANVKTLIERDRVRALVGLVGTGNVEAVEKDGILDRSRVPLVGARTGSARQWDPYVFHIRASYAQEIVGIVRNALTIGLTRVAVFYQNDAFGRDGLEVAKSEMERAGHPIVAQGSYPKNTTDVASAVQAINAANPQMVVMVSNTAASAAFVTAFRAAGSTAQLTTVSVTDFLELAQKVGPALARGTGIVEVFPSPYHPKDRLALQFNHAINASHIGGLRNTYATFEGYISAAVLVQALAKAGHDPDGKSIASALESLGRQDLGGFEVNFSHHQHEGSGYTDLAVIGPNSMLLQ